MMTKPCTCCGVEPAVRTAYKYAWKQGLVLPKDDPMQEPWRKCRVALHLTYNLTKDFMYDIQMEVQKELKAEGRLYD
jgi:hypothetical protein